VRTLGTGTKRSARNVDSFPSRLIAANRIRLVVPGPTTLAAAVVLKGGVVVPLERGPSTDLAGALGAADHMLSIIVTIMIIRSACSTND